MPRFGEALVGVAAGWFPGREDWIDDDPVEFRADPLPMTNDPDVGWLRPVPGRVSSPFNPARVHPVTGKVRPHRGVDIAAPKGTPVAAVAAGRVAFAGRQRGYGNVVIVDHGSGLTSLYAHLDSIQVGAGQQLAAGEMIGGVGNTGTATGYHLHFERRQDGIAVPPGIA